MSYLTELKNKQIVILGAGLSGFSCARFLNKQGVNFVLNDSRSAALSDENKAQLSDDVKVIEGQWHPESLAAAELIITSPGIDLNEQAITELVNPKAEIVGDVELYCRLVDTPILAVTGSNGKSTVVSLLTHVAENMKVNACLGGNIGTPVLDRLTDQQPADLLILELSSFQLETLHSMKAVAASVLNISDDHLDRHKTIENYAQIKHKIYQQAEIAVVNRQDELSQPRLLVNKQISFGLDKPEKGHFGLLQRNEGYYLAYGDDVLIALADLPLAGMHNALNYLAVLGLGVSYGWPCQAMLPALLTFKGLSHRCEKVTTNDGVLWINDSKATNVGAALAAIEGLAATLSAKNKLILVAGGDGKGADFSPLAEAIERHVSSVFTIGKDGDTIAKLSSKAKRVKDLSSAVKQAKNQAAAGDIVLLSPACASIDMFKNFAERGQMFSQYAQEDLDE